MYLLGIEEPKARTEKPCFIKSITERFVEYLIVTFFPFIITGHLNIFEYNS